MEADVGAVPEPSQHLSRSVFRVRETRGNVDIPLWKRAIQRIDPLRNAGLSAVNLLASAHQANDDSPILVAVQTGDQKLRLRLPEIRHLFSLTHEVSSLFYSPRALRLIKERHMLVWWTRIDQAIVTKVVDVLNEHLHLAHHSALLRRLSSLSLLTYFVSRKSFTKNVDQRPISREKNAIQFAAFIDVLGRDVQSDQRLACSGDAGDKADRLTPMLSRRANNLRNRLRSLRQVNGRSVTARYVGNRVPVVERGCSLDDRRGRTITTTFPRGGVNRTSFGKPQYLLDNLAEGFWSSSDRKQYTIALRCAGIARERLLRGGSDQDWCDVWLMAGLMKVLEVKSIVPNLIDSVRLECLFVHLEFQNENNWPNEENNIDPPSQAWNRVLEVNLTVPSIAVEDILENPYLLNPGFTLRALQSGAIKITAPHQLAKNLVGGLVQERSDLVGVVFAPHAGE